jgi:Metallo-peptidase family M12B Reprolysin-like
MTTTTPTIRRLATTCLILAACSESAPTSPEPDDAGAIPLEMRLHLLQSNELEALDATLTDDEVGEVIRAVSEVWAQAGVVWRIEQIVREPALNPDVFRQVLNDPRGNSTSLVAAVLPKENLRLDIWNVFLIRDFGGAVGGVYLLRERVVVSAELDPMGDRDLSGGTTRILAHELGHSLGLNHVPCTAAGNLMAPGCPRGTRTRLEPVQIQIARQQAETGQPF